MDLLSKVAPSTTRIEFKVVVCPPAFARVPLARLDGKTSRRKASTKPGHKDGGCMVPYCVCFWVCACVGMPEVEVEVEVRVRPTSHSDVSSASVMCHAPCPTTACSSPLHRHHSTHTWRVCAPAIQATTASRVRAASARKQSKQARSALLGLGSSASVDKLVLRGVPTTRAPRSPPTHSVADAANTASARASGTKS